MIIANLEFFFPIIKFVTETTVDTKEFLYIGEF